MRYSFIIGLILLFLSTPLETFACSCKWGGNFIKVAKRSNFVIKGRVADRTYHLSNGKSYSTLQEALKAENESGTEYKLGESITVEILQVIQGSKTVKKIRIITSSGADCRVGTHNFEVGSTYMFSLRKSIWPDSEVVGELSSDYVIFGCSEHWLKFDSANNSVTGYIKGRRRSKIRTWPYEKLLARIED